MKVAIDATPLMLSSGGIQRYTQELSKALAEQFPEDDFTLVSDQPFHMPSPCPRNLRRGAGLRNWCDRRWWLCGVEREMSRIGAELFHGANFVVPWLPLAPSVVTMHDLSVWLEGAWHGDARFVRWRAGRQIGLGLATMIVTPSQTVRRQVIDYFRVHPARIAAIPLAAAPHFQPAPAGPQAVPYFLYVGTLEPRKNLGLLLRAWREVRQRHDADLILAGRIRADFREPIEPEAGLRVLGEVADESLPELYSGAAACLYPSLYEGFGLPVLEAMQCGALVIASRDPAIGEVAGDAAVLLDAHDARAWVETMIAVLTCPASFAPWRARSLERARSFSWARTARLTREVYVEALRRFGG